jgi:hypothetical protein
LSNILARAANRPTLQLIFIFIFLDAIVLFCTWLSGIDVLESRFYRLGRDRGIVELVEYGKFAIIIYLLLTAWRNTGQPVFRAWMILFSIMLADNLIGIHEEVGELIITYIELPDVGLRRAKDLAEIIVLVTLEGSAMLYVLFNYIQSDRQSRIFSLWLIPILGLFVYFALVVDAVGPYLLEETGEIVSMTCILAWVHNHYRKTANNSSGDE